VILGISKWDQPFMIPCPYTWHGYLINHPCNTGFSEGWLFLLHMFHENILFHSWRFLSFLPSPHCCHWHWMLISYPVSTGCLQVFIFFSFLSNAVRITQHWGAECSILWWILQHWNILMSWNPKSLIQVPSGTVTQMMCQILSECSERNGIQKYPEARILGEARL